MTFWKSSAPATPSQTSWSTSSIERRSDRREETCSSCSSAVPVARGLDGLLGALQGARGERDHGHEQVELVVGRPHAGDRLADRDDAEQVPVGVPAGHERSAGSPWTPRARLRRSHGPRRRPGSRRRGRPRPARGRAARRPPRPVGVGGEDGVDALARAQQRGQARIVDRLAEVHEAPAAPGADGHVSGFCHAPECMTAQAARGAKLTSSSSAWPRTGPGRRGG